MGIPLSYIFALFIPYVISKYNAKRTPVVIINHAILVLQAAKQQCSTIKRTKNAREMAKLLAV